MGVVGLGHVFDKQSCTFYNKIYMISKQQSLLCHACPLFFHVFHSTDLSGVVLHDDTHLTGITSNAVDFKLYVVKLGRTIVIRFGSWTDSVKIKLKLNMR